MRVIQDRNEYDGIWNKIYSEFNWRPRHKDWLTLPIINKKYHLDNLNKTWTEEQEQLINSVFKKVWPAEMYALDWQHDCFVFDPNEDIPLDYWYYDSQRDCNVYFPSYYPNGDWYFFISTDWRMGLFGHPWEHEIYVMGEELIREFDAIKEKLNITEIKMPENFSETAEK